MKLSASATSTKNCRRPPNSMRKTAIARPCQISTRAYFRRVKTLDFPHLRTRSRRGTTDAWTNAFGKVDEYIGAGVGVVVVLDPEKRTASAYRPNTQQEDFHVGYTLIIPDVLPGFAVPVAALFE